MASDKRPGYEFFEHTADVGMVATGETLEELLVHCAQGLVRLIAEESAVEPKESRLVELHARSAEALLREWLTQLIVWFDAERFLPSRYELSSVSATVLRGRVSGEQFDPSRHVHGVEVKGVTRHQFLVEQRGGRWHARLIFDV